MKDDEILWQGPGATITRSYRPGSLIPYGRVTRPDGRINHGWIDLRGRPELVASIPEAQASEGLLRLLRVIATPGSPLMSGACECGVFDRPELGAAQRWQAGGFVTVVFQHAEKNVDPQALIELAADILRGVRFTPEYGMAFEMMVAPLKLFFERTDCHDLLIKSVGVGASESKAWEAFNYAASAAAQRLEELCRKACA